MATVRSPLRRRRRTRDEQGAVAIEAAIVFPLLALLVFGMIEFSYAMRDYASVSSLSRTGVRVAATAADRGPATCYTYPGAPVCTSSSAPALAQMAADAVQNAGSAMPSNQINYMLVYKANAHGYPGADSNRTMPANCSTTPNCVMFRWVDSQKAFRYAGGAWRSASISACFPGTPAKPLDRVGVYVNASHHWLTGLFGTTVTMADRSMMNFEPLATQSCGAEMHL